MKNRIINLFKKAYKKLFCKETRRIEWGKQFDESAIPPAAFRKMFEAAYPDVAKFLNSIQLFPGTEDAFAISGSLVASELLAATGLTISYRDWERKCIEQVRREYPDLKILVFHIDKYSEDSLSEEPVELGFREYSFSSERTDDSNKLLK